MSDTRVMDKNTKRIEYLESLIEQHERTVWGTPSLSLSCEIHKLEQELKELKQKQEEKPMNSYEKTD